MIQVYFPLHDGSLAEIVLLPMEYPPSADFSIHISYADNLAADVKKSFLIAQNAAYNLLCKKGHISSKDTYAFFCNIRDTQGNDIAHKIFGKSGGFAFFIALIIKIVPKTIKIPINRNSPVIIATGEISTDLDHIEKVDSLIEKLTGSIKVLPSGNPIFYPQDNKDILSKEYLDQSKRQREIWRICEKIRDLGAELEGLERGEDADKIREIVEEIKEKEEKDQIEIDQTKQEIRELLKEEAKARGIAVIPVATLRDVLDYLIKKKRPPWIIKTLILMALSILLYFTLSVISCPLIFHLLHWGRISMAGPAITISRYLFPWKECIIKVHQEYTETFQDYTGFSTLGRDGKESLPCEISHIPPLSPSHGYRFRIRTSHPIYLYICEETTSKEIYILFPHSNDDYGTLLDAQGNYAIPKNGYFKSQGNKGYATIYIFMSRWMCKDVERLFSMIKEGYIFSVQKEKLELIKKERDRLGRGCSVKEKTVWYE